MPNICVSGGAKGADWDWTYVALEHGHEAVQVSFVGHHLVKCPGARVVHMAEEALREATPHCLKANKTLRRKFPSDSPTVNSLLRRNYYQIRSSDSLYAVAPVKEGQVQGGTGWAVQMFIDKYPPGSPCEAYVFDADSKSGWVKWGGHFWAMCSPPPPSGIYAGIGTRDITPEGTRAIRYVYGS